MIQSNILEALEPIVNTFQQLGIEYYITGSVASSMYGMARATLDIDLVSNLKLTDVKILSDNLKKEYYIDEKMIEDAIRTKSSFNLIFLRTMLKIDVFILKDKSFPQKAFERKKKEIIADESNSIEIFISSAEDVLLNKLEWYKAGGETSERQWNDILGIIKVQSENLDLNYITDWAAQLNILDLLKRALSESLL